MAKFLLNLFIILSLLQYIQCICLNNDPCICELDEYTKIDITATINATEPSLSDRVDNITYYYHGCINGEHKISNQTISISLLKINITNNTIPPVHWNNSQYKFNYNEDKDIFQLLYLEKDIVVATVHLLCDNFPQSFIKILNINSNELILSSPHNCKIIHHPGLSSGSILIILLIIGIAIYLIGGGLILYFVRGATGLELIPNIDFWRNLPGLVKDGIIFLFSGCNVNAINTSETYDRI